MSYELGLPNAGTSQRKNLNCLIWRGWNPTYEFPSIFSSVLTHGMGGTELEMLLHARELIELGHRVEVLGATRHDVVEDNVKFIGCDGREKQTALIASGRMSEPDLIFMEGSYHGAPLLRKTWPNAKIVHVGQNIDTGRDRAAFAMAEFVDVYAFVGPGQLADYCSRYPHLRQKFMLLRNCVPWKWIHGQVSNQEVKNRIAWIGAWGKRGIRQWAEVVARVLDRFPQYEWMLYGPPHGGDGDAPLPSHVLHGLRFPADRVHVYSLPLPELLPEIARARVVIASLGNEAGPISILDAHAMGRPVISGNDMVYGLSNPNGTGVRVTTSSECYEALVYLLERPSLCDQLGAAGKELVIRDFTEQQQQIDLQRIVDYLFMRDALGPIASYRGSSRLKQQLIELKDRILRKMRNLQVSTQTGRRKR